jgi:hypothetical protein
MTIRAMLSLRWPPRLAVAFCALAGVLLPAGFGMVAGVPEPLIQDEFSYLLGADTFARGRLTNPSPPLPEFFEAPHVIVSPTYQSKYPPGQALVLAAGQRMLGHPIWGVWISCGLFAGALCWMLQAWTSRHWAFAVTLICAATLGTGTYWAQSYWGGMLPASGGALLLGAVRRTLRHPEITTSSLLGIGLLVLVNTRPYEGALLSLPAAVLLAGWLVRDPSHTISRKATRFLVPVAAILAVGLALMMYYNRAVTGSFLQTPYDLHLRQYLHRGVFVFSPPRSPDRAPVARVARFYNAVEAELVQKESIAVAVVGNFAVRLPTSLVPPFGLMSVASIAGPPFLGVTIWLALLVAVWRPRSTRAISFTVIGGLAAEGLVWLYLPAYPVPLVPVLVPAWLIAFDRIAKRFAWARFVSTTVLLFAAGQALVWWWFPHYAAPATSLVAAAIAASAQRLSRGLPAGAVYRLLPLVSVLLAAQILVAFTLNRVGWQNIDRRQPETGFRTPGDTVRYLAALPGDDLVFVKYDEQYSKDLEWVYNGADLASSPVIFAHYLDDDRNAALMTIYRERSAWILRLSPGEASLSPHTGHLLRPER